MQRPKTAYFVSITALVNLITMAVAVCVSYSVCYAACATVRLFCFKLLNPVLARQIGMYRRACSLL